MMTYSEWEVNRAVYSRQTRRRFAGTVLSVISLVICIQEGLSSGATIYPVLYNREGSWTATEPNFRQLGLEYARNGGPGGVSVYMGTGVNIYWFPTATTAPTGLTLFRGGPFEGGLWGISEFLHIIDYPLMDFLGGFWQEKCRGGFTFDSLVIPKEIVGLDWKRISVLGGALSLAGSLLGFWGMGRLKAPLRCSFHKIT